MYKLEVGEREGDKVKVTLVTAGKYGEVRNDLTIEGVLAIPLLRGLVELANVGLGIVIPECMACHRVLGNDLRALCKICLEAEKAIITDPNAILEVLPTVTTTLDKEQV